MGAIELMLYMTRGENLSLIFNIVIIQQNVTLPPKTFIAFLGSDVNVDNVD